MESRKIHVVIEGLEPGYMQSRMDPRHREDAKLKTGSNDNDAKKIEEAAHGKLYLDSKKRPCIPSTHIYDSLVNAARNFKTGRKSNKEIVASAVKVEPGLIPIAPPNWEIDEQYVRNPFTRGRLLSVRPRFPGGWTAEFDLIVEDEQLTDETLKRITDHAGLRCGIGSFTPPHNGPYGRFMVREFKSD